MGTYANIQKYALFRIRRILAAAAILSACQHAAAGDGIWNKNATGNWSDVGNWTGSVPGAPASTATFNTVGTSAAGVITLDGAYTVGTLQFNSATGYTIAGSSVLTLGTGLAGFPAQIRATNHIAGRNHSIAVPLLLMSNLILDADQSFSAGTFTISGSISGAFGITKLEAGVISLDGASDYTGITTIQTGTLRIRNVQALGAGSGAAGDGTLVQSGATLLLSPPTAAAFVLANEQITLNGGTLSSGSNVTVAGPVVLQSTSSIIGGAFTGIISGAGGVSLSGTVRLSSANTYTGQTQIIGGTIDLDDANAFGAGLSAVDLLGGTLNLNVATLRGISILAGGRLNVLGSGLTHSNAITSFGGKVGIGGGATLATLTLGSGTTSVLQATGTGTRALGGISGAGSVKFDPGTTGSIRVTGPLDFIGDFQAIQGTTTLAGGGFVHGLLRVDGGTVSLEQNLAATQLLLNGGKLTSINGATLSTSPLVAIISGGTLSTTIAGASAIDKTGPGTATFQSLGTYDGPVHVQAGTLIISGNAGLGSAVGRTSVSLGATLLINAGVTIADGIDLNNSAGSSFGAALAPLPTASPLALISGDITLGASGAIIGASNATLELSGSIQGGSLVSKGVTLTNGTHTYTGSTIVREGLLKLIDQGRLTQTSSVVVESSGTFVLDNSRNGNFADRLADTIPIGLHGGSLIYRPVGVGASSETLGTMTLESGASALALSNTLLTKPTIDLLVNRLDRQPGTTLTIQGTTTGDLGFNEKIHFTIRPTSSGGLLGGWAIVAKAPAYNFAAYADAPGVQPLDTYASSLSAGASANVQIGSAALPADATINALMTIGAGGITVDLGGHTLIVQSGGILAADASAIRNGTLLPGAFSGGELFIHTFGFTSGFRQEISAAIADQGATPTSLVKSGPQTLYLAGPNSYTGSTVVVQGSLGIANATSLPAGRNADLAGGQLFADFATSPQAPLVFNNLRIRNSGLLGGGGAPLYVQAASYQVESGAIYASLQGSGTMTKTTAGTIILRADNANYSGRIDIIAGVLQLGDSNSAAGDRTSGTGVVTVFPGGRLVTAGGQKASNVVVAGGAFERAGVVGTYFLDAASWSASGSYNFRIADAAGNAGVGYDYLSIAGQLRTPQPGENPFLIRLNSSTSAGTASAAANFDPTASYNWKLAWAADASLLNPNLLTLDPSGFLAYNPVTDGQFALAVSGGDLVVQYRPVPEPSAMFAIAGALGLLRRRRGG